jgi:hypothetical protein
VADSFELTVSVALSSSDGASIVKIEEKLPVEGTLSELSGIFHQVHELMERIRDEKAGLPARRVRGVGACLSAEGRNAKGGDSI